MIRDDGRKAEARLIPIREIMGRLSIEGLRRAGTELTGPCPVCGGSDRFSINLQRNLFNCRICDRGGDGLELVQFVQGCDFAGALDFLLGQADAQVDPEQLARRRKMLEEQDRQREQAAVAARAKAIRDAREIWQAAQPGEGSPAQAYLAGRGISFPAGWPPTLRYAPQHPYLKHWPGRGVIAWHYGPCLIAAVQNADGRVEAVHQTWFDPGRPGKKAVIKSPDGQDRDPKGKPWPAKLVRGSKKGAAIRLTPKGQAPILVMGEGIETTGSAIAEGILPAATFWAGVDLGNMSGRQQKIPGKRHSGVPDMGDQRAFVPPAWVERLVLIQDGDSDPEATRAKLQSCLRRAMRLRPGLTGAIVAADPGTDLNDMRMKEITK